VPADILPELFSLRSNWKASPNSNFSGTNARRKPPGNFINYTYSQPVHADRLHPRAQNSTRAGGKLQCRVDSRAAAPCLPPGLQTLENGGAGVCLRQHRTRPGHHRGNMLCP